VALVPSAIVRFFERTQFADTPQEKPWWLKSSIDEIEWRVDVGKNDLREVREGVRGGLVLRWDALMPSGKLTDPSHATLCAELKALMIAVADTRESTRSINTVFRTILNFAEFLGLKYGSELLSRGLLVAHIDDVEDFLEAHVEAGTCATGRFIERFERYLDAAAASERPSDMASLKALFGQTAGNQISFLAIGEAISIDWERLRASYAFRAHLSEYGYCHKVRHDNGPRTTSGYVDVLKAVGQASHAVPALRGWALGRLQSLADVCRPFRGGIDGRTPTMPKIVRERLMLMACSWMLNEAPALERHVEELVGVVVDRGGGDGSDFVSLLNMVERGTSFGSLQHSADFIERIHARRGNRRHPHAEYRLLPIVMGMIRLHIGVCYVLTALLSCSRRTEVCDLSHDSLFSVDGRDYLTIEQAKRGRLNVRPTFDKPVPRIVRMAMETMANLKKQLLRIIPIDDLLVNERAFFFFSMRGIRPFDVNDAGAIVRMVGSYFDLRNEDGSAWTLASHQLRRAFAMTFFHSEGSEAALPALAWLMGHHSVEETWRYVSESMTGKELSHAEACMAMAAVGADSTSHSAGKLKEMLLQHFGCDDLTVLDPEEAMEYLEMLSETGEISVRPVQIATSDRKSFTVLVSFRSGQ